jgi:hypothetical protein
VALIGIVAWSSTHGNGETQSAAPVVVASATHPLTSAPASQAVQPSEKPATEPSEQATEGADDSEEMTASQEQAVRKAQEYIDYAAFSRSGLIKQLKFEGFSTSDAKFGVDHIGADWMEQAELKAKEYLDYTSFSRSGLIKQLEFEGFTRQQAEHGVKAAGL